MKFLQVESIFYTEHWSVCDGVEREEGTTVAGGGTWNQGVAAKLMETTQVRSIWKFDAWTNSRWWTIFAKVEFVEFVSNIVYELGYVWTLSYNRCGSVTCSVQVRL